MQRELGSYSVDINLIRKRLFVSLAHINQDPELHQYSAQLKALIQEVMPSLIQKSLEAEKLIPDGIDAYKSKNKVLLCQITAKIFQILNSAKVIKDHPHWKYPQYDSFDDYIKKVDFSKYISNGNTQILNNQDELFRKNLAGWTAQVIGGALGTAIEGYCTAQLKKAFGEINDYVRPPNTYNDDIPMYVKNCTFAYNEIVLFEVIHDSTMYVYDCFIDNYTYRSDKTSPSTSNIQTIPNNYLSSFKIIKTECKIYPTHPILIDNNSNSNDITKSMLFILLNSKS